MNNKILIAVIAIIIIICAGAFAWTNMQSGSSASIDIDANALEERGALVVDSKEVSENNGLYSSDSADENAVLVKNNGVLTLVDSIINKTGDTSSGEESVDFYGTNSAVLVNGNGSLDISNVKISTNSKGSNGIFVTNALSSGSGDSASVDGNGLAEGSSSGGSQGGAPPEASGNGSGGGAAPGASGNGSDGGTPPEMPNGNGSQGGTPPAMPSGNNSGGSPPEAPGGNGSDGGSPPGASGNGSDGGSPPAMASGNNSGGTPPGASGNGTGGGSPPESSGDSNGGSNGGNDPSMESSQGSSDGSSEANIQNVEITTYSDKSRGLDATYNGKITAKNVIINTNGQSCAALATDRGEGEVHVTNSELNTGVSKESGRGSPIIYSTGNITLENSKGTAYVSQIACIEGKNSIELTNCDLSAAAGGNREDNGEYVDLGGVFIYQSMSGDADVGTATLSSKNSVLSIESDSDYYKTAPMFHVTNTKAIINLEGTELNFGSGVLLNVSGQNQWGNEGSNGGELTFNANSETLDGNVIVDSISSLNMTLGSTSYVGAINPSDDFGQTDLVIESGSDWTLDGDSHISSLENNGEINYNGHTLYVNGVAYTEDNPFK